MKDYIGDILVYDKKHQLVVTVVTMNHRGKPQNWAIKLRRNLYVNAKLPKTPFFVIAMPEHFYLWKDVEDEGEIVPTYEMVHRFTLQSFFKNSGLSVEELDRDTFELLTNAWFSFLQLAHEKMDICSQHPDWLLEKNQTWLFNSGLFEAIKNGKLITRYEYDDSLC